MRLILAMLLLVPGAVGQDAIRHARALSNQYIANRDLAGYTSTITPDFTITTGNGTAFAHDGFLTRWTQLFHDPHWRGCIRIPDHVEISSAQPLAAEHGHFRCQSTERDGIEVYTGTYLAMWVRQAALWKTRSELFVTLACSGSAACKPQ